MQALIAKFQVPVFIAPYQTRVNRTMLFLQTGTLVSGVYCVLYYSDTLSLAMYGLAGAVAGIVCGFWAGKLR
ncbi:MAG TPA: hypothetical protein VK174_05930 [Chitinophagales bacterium]|nr:hypothetical protein [Chitinophagales bacterium]